MKRSFAGGAAALARPLIVMNSGNWQLWRSALAAVRAGTGDARAHFYGTSITWGSAATAPYDTNAFTEQVKAILSTWIGPVRPGVIWPIASSTSRYALSGGWSDGGLFGLEGHQTWTAGPAAAGAVTIGPIVCDTFRVFYPTYGAGAGTTFEAVVDGGTPVVLSQVPAGANVFVDVPAGSLGSHTLVLRRAAGTGTAYIYGVEARGGSASVYVSRGGVGGSTSAQWAASGNGFLDSIAVGFTQQAAHLYVIELGINDWNAQAALATFSTNLTAIVAAAKSTGGVLLLGAPTPQVAPSTPGSLTWQQYLDTMQAVAVAQGVSMFSVDHLVGSRGPGLMYSDGIHWSNEMHYEVGAALASLLEAA